ncbi:MAG: SHOCT domain-containing protein [Allosphingosinicella sp.]|uniref:SHOCT domain-containing protein n=1 Tax=Allosphingosinicella sp. TaxID=2823234 RepID=UPI00394AB16E
MRAALLIGCLLMASSPAVARERAAPPEPADHPDWAAVRSLGVAEITGALFDPASAQITWSSGFRWGYAKPLIGRRTHGWIACGSINAKNRLGGYVGAQPFWIMAAANGTVTTGMVANTISSCDEGGGPPPNPELIAISPVVPGSSTGPVSVASELEKLAELRDRGIITQAEFETQKARLLAR